MKAVWFGFLLVSLVHSFQCSAHSEDVIRVVVWDERQPAQREAYEDFLGNAIADHLRSRENIEVRSMALDDAEQGLSTETLDFAQVLIWWGHVRQHEVSIEKAQDIVRRIREGRLALVALHSAHWSRPFVEAMYERTRLDAAQKFPAQDGREVVFDFIAPSPFTIPAHGSLQTPAYYATRRGANAVHVRVDLPNCCFPDFRADGAASTMTVLAPQHPLAVNVPMQFRIPQTEMYNEPFHVPEADEVVFRESWAGGESFPSGMVWNLGQGRVVYFRPGHETFAVYKQPETLQIIENAVRWLAMPRQKMK